MKILEEVSHLVRRMIGLLKSLSQYMEDTREDEDEQEENGSDESDEESEETGDHVDEEPSKETTLSSALEALDLEEVPRDLSRSPPRSRSGSPPPSLREETAHERGTLKEIVSSDISRTRNLQQRKYHSKRSTRQAGRSRGSKAKQDTRVKLDTGGVWD